jgi:hypothetical protein
LAARILAYLSGPSPDKNQYGNEHPMLACNFNHAAENRMKYTTYLLASLLLIAPNVWAERSDMNAESDEMRNEALDDARARPGLGMREDSDGNIMEGEYQVISKNGGVTRRPCPYTCEMKGIPQTSCRTWVSKSDSSLCYVEDTRLSQNAVPMGQ